MSLRYLDDFEILGDEPTQALLVRVRNTAELARGHGGIASAAQYVADKFGAQRTMERQVLQGIATEMQGNFRSKGVAADVSVVDALTQRPVGTALKYAGAAALGASAVGLAWLLVRRHR